MTSADTSLNDLLNRCDGCALTGDGSTRISAIALDSRAVRPGTLFAALPGTQVNGADFVPAALENGASALLVPSGIAGDFAGASVPAISHPDVRTATAALAAALYGPMPEQLFAVTGTNGKTSIAHFTRWLLEACGQPAVSAGTLGLKPDGIAELPELTSPDAISLARALGTAKTKGYDHAVIEASSHGLDQRRLEGLRFQAAAFTNLSHDHLEYHGTMESYGAAKARLFTDLLTDDATAVLNADDAFVAGVTANCARTWTYGRAGNELKLVDYHPTAAGQTITADLFGQRFGISVPLIGAFQAENVLASVGLCLAAGMDLDCVLKALPDLPTVPGRMDIAVASEGRTVLVDYAHTPAALETALKSARPHCAGKLHVIIGAGGDRDPSKRAPMGRAAADFADVAWITDDNPRTEDPDAIRAAVLAADPALSDAGDRPAAIRSAIEAMEPGDLLLIAGKGHEPYQDVMGVKHPFDDRLVSAEIFAEVWS